MTTPADDPDRTARLGTDARTGSQPRPDGAQFAPGTMVAERFRISSILGAGGMGEVYRADDLKLGQTVALKFLPARLARDPILLARLHDEVRVGRQVTHPNVGRVYDIVDWEGAQFVAMEYVDGEDLSRLLRRIGRLAHDKAVDIARGITAGLLAAHAKGILHRDLKPANVMVDARGDARVMDFGLALAAGEDDGTISGTPAYMAPEQLAGAPATIQSDLYSLGLVMYELFTGKRAHNARTLPERLRDASDITTPSSVIRDIDPAVERIILRCLAHDPAQRPRSAREVINALPGGDPLAAALAAGETPSPRVVAAAGAEGSLAPRVAWAMLASVLILLAALTALRRQTSVGRYAGLERSPEVLRHRANDVLRTLSVPVYGDPVPQVVPARNYIGWLQERPGAGKWESLRRGPAPFTYRLEYGVRPSLSSRLPVTANAPGWTAIEVDANGRLTYLLTAPAAGTKAKPLDWRPLLEAAGVEASTLRADAPRHAPAAPFDARGAWRGTYPGDATPIRVEAAAWQGAPVFFRITGAWDETSDPFRNLAFSGSAHQAYLDVTFFLMWGAGLFLALRNLHLRRGDRQGALRVALAVFAIGVVAAALELVRIGQFDLRGIFTEYVASAALGAGLLFLLYIALEPYARRRWPEQLIAWARLTAGQVRDPLVGRHVLIGVAAGVAHATLSAAARMIGPSFLGEAVAVELHLPPVGIAESLQRTLLALGSGLHISFISMMLLVVATIILRKRALAIGAMFLFVVGFFSLAIGPNVSYLPAYALIAVLLTFILARYGMLALAVTQGVAFALIVAFPIAAPAWVVTVALIPLLAVIVLAVWAFYVSLGGQSPFSASLLDE